MLQETLIHALKVLFLKKLQGDFQSKRLKKDHPKE